MLPPKLLKTPYETGDALNQQVLLLISISILHKFKATILPLNFAN
jgi:hypothetical protein